MLSQRIAFAPDRDQEAFDALPARPAVYALRAADPAAEPYVAKTANLRRRIENLLGAREGESKKLSLRDRITAIEYSVTGSDFESRFLLYRTLRELFRATYRNRLRLHAAPLVKLNYENPYPRAYVTRRIGKLHGRSLYYGPFPSRAAADKFLNATLDLFKSRRCTFDLNPDPTFPGCVYSEMKMCLAPCFKGCTDEDYAAEMARVQAFLDTAGESLAAEMQAERERLSAALEFEAAAALHARLDKIAAARALLPREVRRLDQMRGLMIQPSAEREHVTFFRVDAGCLSGPFAFPILGSLAIGHAGSESAAPGEAHRTRSRPPQSMESRVEAALAESAPHEPHSAGELIEHVALLKRWMYRSTKVGELFLADAAGHLPLRRIVRGISRVYRGERPESDPSETAAKEYWLARGREVLGDSESKADHEGHEG